MAPYTIHRYIDDHKRVGAVLFILSYTAACTLFLPGSLFTVGAGFLFKPFPLALLVVLLGDVFASVGSFIFGRYIFYDWVKNMMSKHPKFNALDQVIKDDGTVLFCYLFSFFLNLSTDKCVPLN